MNQQSDKGFTAVTMAAMDGRIEVIRYLAGHGADLSVKAQNGLTPLGFASLGNHAEVVEFLKQKNAR
ncbi:MAG: ankyrin repeat domain-containing protein [Calothrix sp. SM1_5_4]|nr:ankyrin repeat domain-containing protein [Calothrix sp. SM1_5_4]